MEVSAQTTAGDLIAQILEKEKQKRFIETGERNGKFCLLENFLDIEVDKNDLEITYS